MFGDGVRKWFVVPRSWKGRFGVFFGGAAVLAVCFAARYFWGLSSAKAEVAANVPPSAADANAPPRPLSSRPANSVTARNGNVPIPEVVAAINGQAISRDELADECRMPVRQGRAGVDGQQVPDPRRMPPAGNHRHPPRGRRGDRADGPQLQSAGRTMAENDAAGARHQAGPVCQRHHLADSLALRKLAGEKLQVSQKELTDAFEAEYGAAVKARIIVCTTEQRAREVQALAAANPAEFGNLAKEYSVDAPSASVKGMIQPIRKHSSCPEIEQAAFALADGQVSNVIRSQGQFVVLKRDGLIAARNIKLEQGRRPPEPDHSRPEDALRVRRHLPGPASGARVQNVYNDPRLQQQVGREVVALVNGEPIYVRQLDDECLARHGTEVLQGLIGRRMLELACNQNRVDVSEKEIDAEIARLASLLTRPLPDGSPDVKGWLALVTDKQGLSVEMYRREIIWPQLALRKLAGGKIDVTEEDIEKGIASRITVPAPAAGRSC